MADTLRRRDEQHPLIPNYQGIIIDEAHKFLQAARTMYGAELSGPMHQEMVDSIFDLEFRNEAGSKAIRKTVLKLGNQSLRLFLNLLATMKSTAAEEDTKRFGVSFDATTTRHLQNIYEIADKLSELLSAEPVRGNCSGRKAQILWELEQIRDQVALFMRHEELICWLELPQSGTATGATKAAGLCASCDSRLAILTDEIYPRHSILSESSAQP